MQGKLLVFGQFSMIAVLLFAGGWHLPPWAWMLFALGLVVFAAAGFALGIRNFTIMPDPRTGNTSVLLCGSAVTFGAPSLLRWVALAVCVVVLVLKVRYEEGLLGQRHPEYKQRMAGTYRLVPGIW